MKTTHTIFFDDSKDMGEIKSNSIDLLITSPPYPMIEMWDELFSSKDDRIGLALKNEKGKLAYDLMHENLSEVWEECVRVVKESGIICINIGDATRKIGKTFQLFPNHVKVSQFFQDNGSIPLPMILWRKPTNSPTKFMGSGMLPSNAYVTLEHEYILLFRNGLKNRKFPPNSETRYNSAFFWEERNRWFSDIWKDMRGVSQTLQNNGDLRERSAAFPLELPYRLINMFSVYGDTVLDPFWGTGTTTLAAMILARNSIGFELDSEFISIFEENIKKIKMINETFNKKRIKSHIRSVENYSKRNHIKYTSINYRFPVITSQEQNILFYSIQDIISDEHNYSLIHKPYELGDME
ncbi:MAG: site-specific DNA-methyltransferase [Candidatus Lokiarchaeota archaeon]|nr:site-specific DNA-methyltransferase [Candidatus Lokiarchaeota archaeon]